MIPNDTLDSLKNIIIKILKEELSYSDLNKIISISRSIITPYLLHTEKYFISLASKNGYDVKDITDEIISEFFSQGNGLIFKNFNKFAESLDTSIYTIENKNLFLAYSAFLRKVSNIYISRAYAMFDPIGYKIKRNIKDILPTETLALKKSVLGNIIYIIKDNNNHEFYNFVFEDFERAFHCKISGKMSTRELLNILYDTLINFEPYVQEISLNNVVILFKNYYGNSESSFGNNRDGKNKSGGSFVQDSLGDIPDMNNINENNKIELENILNETLNDIKLKIISDYFYKSKLSSTQSIAIYNAISDYLYDLIFYGEKSKNYFDYLNSHLNISKEDYGLKYKAKFEYFAKLSIEKIRNYFLNEE